MKSRALCLAGALPLAVSAATCDPIRSAVEHLLAAYSAKSLDQVSSQLTSEEILVLGSDLSEVARTPADVTALMRADFALWGSARFGTPTFMDCRLDSSLATAAFDSPFTMQRNDGGTMTVTVRFLTVWRRETQGRWLLTQLMSSTPTVGASASDLLKATKK